MTNRDKIHKWVNIYYIITIYAIRVTQLNTFSKNKYGFNMRCNDTR